MMGAKLIRIDRNGSKYYEGMVKCDRCGGVGGSDVWMRTDWTCWKCGGTGKIFAKWVERTPEYEAKLAARRHAKWKAEQEKTEAERKAREAEEEAKREAEEAMRKAEEERIKAEKAKSQYVGEVGDKIQIEAVYDHSAWFDVRDMFGRPERRYVHTFKDEDGNVFVWKTGCGVNADEGDRIILKGTVKDHSEYKDEKQTNLLRCKITKTDV